MNKILSFLTNYLHEEKAYAHCDIPCGIYDPYLAQRAAHTILRMTQLLTEIKQDDDLKSDHTIARITHVKEDHCNLLEEELETLRNDYFKPEHFGKFQNLEELFKKALTSSAKARQSIDLVACEETLENILQISEIFYQSKNVTPIRVKSVYPTEREIVLYK